jgi:hypothetical protein
MAGEIPITKDFPPAREKAVLLELLNIMRGTPKGKHRRGDLRRVGGSHFSKTSHAIHRPVIR